MRRFVYSSLKVLHLMGLVLFLGSIFGHIVAGILGGGPVSGDRFLAAREHIAAATQFLTVPGLGLLLLSGVGLWLMGWSVKNSRWLGVHMGLAVLVTLIAFVVVLPAGAEMMALASTDMVANMEKIVAANRFEDIGGAVNVLLVLIITGLGVAKPRWVRKRGYPGMNP